MPERPDPSTIPAPVWAAYREGRWRRAWTNEVGVVTYEVRGPTGVVHFVKLAPARAFPPLAAEAARMRWAQDHLRVPAVVGAGVDGGIQWLVTEALRGRDATRRPWKADPDRVVPILGRGLRRFHEAPVASCPFSFRLDDALGLAQRRVDEGIVDAERDLHPEHLHFGVRGALDHLLATRPDSEDLVVCHGDYCFPNIIIDDDAQVGYVDLGELGVADRWWDLAVATWSTTWNVGPGHENALLGAYGVKRDPERMAFYRLLYDLVS